MLALLMLSVVLAGGCEMERRVVKQSGWNKMFTESEWYDGPARGSAEDQATNRNNRGYAVELGKYSGAQAFHGVHGLMQTARQDAGLANLWYATVGTKTTVYMGRFKDEDSKEAKTALRKARDAEVDGNAIFAKAKIVKLDAARGEVLDPRDLRSLKGKGLFTLQIGYYDAKYGPDFRRAAETAVDVLRDQDEEAFYYHGPHRSMVLVNAWTHAEAFTLVGQVDRYSNTVRLAQEKYPYNVPNGRAFTDDDDPEYVKSQRSFLVPIR
mgnify:CR=1 FL=1